MGGTCRSFKILYSCRRVHSNNQIVFCTLYVVVEQRSYFGRRVGDRKEESEPMMLPPEKPPRMTTRPRPNSCITDSTQI